MAVYVAGAVAMLRYLVDELPGAADEVFGRAERGIDVVRAPDVQVAEVVYQVSRSDVVAGVELAGSPNDALRGLVTDGPVDVASIGEHELAVFASEVDRYTMHDALLAAAHRVHGSEAIISNDAAFEDAGVETVWD